MGEINWTRAGPQCQYQIFFSVGFNCSFANAIATAQDAQSLFVFNYRFLIIFLKYFRVSVPQAFTGQSLIQNICDAFTLDDAQEALHLGTILMNYGYLFAVIEHAQSVRDDNTLYRMQLPYFWPSHYLQTNNVEYGIRFYKILALILNVFFC